MDEDCDLIGGEESSFYLLHVKNLPSLVFPSTAVYARGSRHVARDANTQSKCIGRVSTPTSLPNTKRDNYTILIPARQFTYYHFVGENTRARHGCQYNTLPVSAS